MNVVVYCGSNPGNNTNYAKAALELGRLDRRFRQYARVWRKLRRPYGADIARGARAWWRSVWC